MRLAAGIAGTIATDTRLTAEFDAICDCGGRLSGTGSEAAALALARRLAEAASGLAVHSIPVAYRGWKALSHRLSLASGAALPTNPLVRSAPTPKGGLEAEVIDLGRGTPEEFEAHAGEIAGRIVLVRHEAMFAAGTIHRRRKYDMARQAGAVGFLIGGPLSGQLVAGSSGRASGDGIPALGLTPEGAARLARTAQGHQRVRIVLETSESDALSETLIVDLPGMTDEWVVLSAHVDGHDLAESAIDNASGVAAALAVVRALKDHVRGFRRGVRLALFSVEEWALTGSALYVDALDAEARAKIALNVNLDSVAGSTRLAALTSGFAGLEPFLIAAAEANGQALRTVRPLMQNSDHAHFALAGIPAFRLVAGFDEPMSAMRHVLTASDTRDKVAPAELRGAALLAAAITAAACQASPDEAARWRR